MNKIFANRMNKLFANRMNKILNEMIIDYVCTTKQNDQ